jgi:hypothetical protein
MRQSAAHPERCIISSKIRPATKGTLGSAICALLRGGAQRAALQAVTPRETRGFGDEPRENVLVGQGSSCPGRFVPGGHLFKASLDPGNQVGRAANDVHREHRVLHPAFPRSCDRRCPGQTDRGNPAPLTSNREGAAPSWPQKPRRPLISQQPGWSLLQKRKLHPRHVKRATIGQPRSSRAGFIGSGVVLADRTRLQRSEGTRTPDQRLLGLPKPPSLARRRRKVARRTNRRKARPAARGARQEGSEAGSCPFPRPKTPRVRVRCPEGPSIKGPHRIGQSMFPGRPGSRMGRQKPWLRRQTQPRPTLSTQRRTSNDPLGARVRGQLQTLTRRIFPLGRGRPKGRQQTAG